MKNSQKFAGQLEECSDLKGVQSELNGMTFKYNFGVGMCHILPRSYGFSHSLCLNNFLQVSLLGNQRDQVPPLRYIIWYDEVSHFFRRRKLLGDMKYLIRSVKQAVEGVGIWTKDNWDMKRVNS